MITEAFARDGIPGLLDVVRREIPNVTLASEGELAAWLPDLGPLPDGWSTATSGMDGKPSRIALHGNQCQSWDACAVINLWTFTGWMAPEVVEDNIACTLIAIRAEEISVNPIALPPSSGSFDVTGVSAEGHFSMAGSPVHARYSVVLAQRVDATGDRSLSRGALLEHNTFVSALADDAVRKDIEGLSDDLLIAQMRVLGSEDLSQTVRPAPVHEPHANRKGDR